MKVLVYYPTNGTNLTVEISKKEEQRLAGLKLGNQFKGNLIGEKFAGCDMRLVGGNDHQGVCMSPKRSTTKRIRLLLSKGDVGYRARKNYVRMRKTVRGDTVSSEIQVISVILLQLPEGMVIEGLTDKVNDKSHLPKKASKLRTIFGIPEGEDIAEAIARRFKEVNPDAKVPKLKIVGVKTEAKLREIAEKKAQRKAHTEELMRRKAEYEKRYGPISS